MPSVVFARAAHVAPTSAGAKARMYHEIGHAGPNSRFRHFENTIGSNVVAAAILLTILTIAAACVLPTARGAAPMLATVGGIITVLSARYRWRALTRETQLTSECAADTFALIHVNHVDRSMVLPVADMLETLIEYDGSMTPERRGIRRTHLQRTVAHLQHRRHFFGMYPLEFDITTGQQVVVAFGLLLGGAVLGVAGWPTVVGAACVWAFFGALAWTALRLLGMNANMVDREIASWVDEIARSDARSGAAA